MIAKQGENVTQELRNKSFQRIGFKIYMTHGTNNNTPDAADFNLENLVLKGTLLRNGRNHTLFSERAKVLFMESGFYDASWDHVRPLSPVYVTLQTATAGLPGVVCLFLNIDLGTVVNLRKDDVFLLDVNVGSGVFHSDLAVNGTFVEFEAEDAVGTEDFTPIITTRSIPGGEGRLQLDLGDNVQRLTFINLDQTTTNEADAVINQYTIQTDRYGQVDNYRELLGKRFAQFRNITDAQGRAQSFTILDGEEFDDVKLDLTFNSAKVTAAKNIIVLRQFVTSAEQVRLAHTTARIHEVKQLAKVGMMSGSLKGELATLQSNKALLIKQVHQGK
jgi:hypothetical protein